MFEKDFKEIAEKLNSEIPEASKNYLLGMRNGTRRLMCETVTGGGVRFYLTKYPDLKFTIDDLKGLDSEEKEDALAAKKKEESMPKEEPKDELIDSPDMLVGTGLTGVISDAPIKDPSTFITDEEPDMVKTVKELYPENNEEPKEEIQTAEPMINKAPTMINNKYTKKYTLTNKPTRRDSGVADVIVISIIVIVYLAIIVNLVIRLK